MNTITEVTTAPNKIQKVLTTGEIIETPDNSFCSIQLIHLPTFHQAAEAQ
ncbi:MAG TPA: hypothetical protein VH500_22190 [Nitrososphaeraceae archaeon]|jgi:hypothetical protein